MFYTPADLIRPEILALAAYHVQEAHKLIKLDAMENPYSLDMDTVKQWLAVMEHAPINRYPDPAASGVKTLLRKIMEIPDTLELIIGNGSDELIQMILLTLQAENRVVLAPEPSFVMYKILSQIVGMKYVGVPLNAEDFSLNLPAFLQAIETHQPAVIFLAYPNNPTGNLFKLSDIEAILKAAKGVVVIDEAYAPFTDAHCLSLLVEYPNLLVMRTLSKLGLAGIRLGFLVGNQAWLEHIEKTRLPYNVNVLSQLTTMFALQHYSTFTQQTQTIREQRAVLFKQLSRFLQLTVWESDANFILFRVENAREIFNRLKQHGVLIKCLDGGHPALKDCLRVTVGTPEENEQFLRALQLSLV